jgi:hypothetical protein
MMADITKDDVDLQQMLANTNKLLAEQQKLMVEQQKLAIETLKLGTENSKLRVDRWLSPVVVVFGAIGSLIGGFSIVYRLLHG